MTIKHSFPATVALSIFLVCAGPAPGQSPAFPVAGKFYVDVDDTMDVVHNGRKLHHGEWGTSESGPVNLIPGDRLVLALCNKVGPLGAKLIFVSEDRKTMINFRVEKFRILRDPDKRDFGDKEFALLRDSARHVKSPHKDRVAFKNKAEWFWGEKKHGTCYVAGLITKDMFEPFTP